MTPENFAYWLQGFIEISDVKGINETQLQIIKDHLALVFRKETPNRIDIQYTPITFTPPSVCSCKSIFCKICNPPLTVSC